jgi:4-diphosphocytidyl-2-C-methyl-D-erythritol kinase
MITYPNFKINIGLNIVAKRADGFHDLQTVFYPVDTLKDELEINRTGEGVRLSVFHVDNLCATEDNLCVKAFRLLQKHFDIDGVEIKLTKNIPFGAGLGGGSADAAFALKMYNELFQLQLSTNELQNLAAQLGSDTAFFIENRPVYATGRGEIMTSINLDLSDYKIEVIKPDFSISTKEAYAGVHPQQPEIDLNELIQKPISEWKYCIHNDFEDTLFVKYPRLQEIKDDFYARGAVYASLSGSGSAVYGIFKK